MRTRCSPTARPSSAVVGSRVFVGVAIGVGAVPGIGSGRVAGCIVVGRARVGGLARLDSWAGSENKAPGVVGLTGMGDVGFGMMAIPTAQSARSVWAHGCCCRSFVDMVVGDTASEAAHWYFAEVADTQNLAGMMPVEGLVEVAGLWVVVNMAAWCLECNNLQRP